MENVIGSTDDLEHRLQSLTEDEKTVLRFLKRYVGSGCTREMFQRECMNRQPALNTFVKLKLISINDEGVFLFTNNFDTITRGFC
jgi:hypothetical protein